jgi:hypothetical protein
MRAANDNSSSVLDMPLRSFLERLVADRGADSGWINIRDEQWPWRHIVAAAERGECHVSRVGRKLLMRREELDRWLALHTIPVRTQATKPEPDDDNPVGHLLERAGFQRR